MISFACPRCKAEYYYADDMAGKKIRCLGPKCGQKLLVPGLAPPTAMNAPAAAKTSPGALRKTGDGGDRERLLKKRLGDLYLKVKGLYKARAGAIADMRRELMTMANDFRQLAEWIDAEFGSSF